MTDNSHILSVSGLRTHFHFEGKEVRAVDGVDFSIAKGEVLGLVGESGSGKTVTGLSILRLIDKPGKIMDGDVVYAGKNLANMSESEIRKLRGNEISMIFQDPLTTLSPTMRIGKQMKNVINAHYKVDKSQAHIRCKDALIKLGIPSAEERLESYPHELSGGMRQRVCIAMAMLNDPSLIIADEPTTALDVTTQAQIIEEVRALRERTGTAFIWVTHDLAVVSEIADRIIVMYSGQIVEDGTADEVLLNPAHPYTKGLLNSIPSNNRSARRLPQIAGFAPSSGEDISGCKFRTRCNYSNNKCLNPPPLEKVSGGRSVRCFFPQAKQKINGEGVDL